MKEENLFSEPVSANHPDKMVFLDPAMNQQETLDRLRNEFPRIMGLLDSINCYYIIDGNHLTKSFGCLSLFDRVNGYKTDAIVIDNTNQINQLVLLNRKSDSVYFGINEDGKVSTHGVFPSKKVKGNNMVIVNDKLIIILKAFDAANKFLSFFNPSQII